MMINKKTLKEFDYIQYFVFKISGTGIFSKADTEKIVFYDFLQYSLFAMKKKFYVLIFIYI
jgi:hypothetical protein